LLGQFHRVLGRIADDASVRISALNVEDSMASMLNGETASQLRRDTIAPSFVAPRDECESRLAQIWQSLLGLQRISVTADFFDNGGHSLLAARLLAQVASAFGKKLPLTTLLESPTIESLATHLRSTAPHDGSHAMNGTQTVGAGPIEAGGNITEQQVFPMRREGNRPPLMIVDAGPFHRPLVRRLGNDQPVYGVALPELASLPRQFTVQDIATNLVDAICASDIEGPCYLAGWSQAGVMAYEMARLLQSRGKEVALLILFDSSNPTYIRSFKEWRKFPVQCYFWLSKAIYHFSKMLRMPLRDAWNYYWKRRRRFELPVVPIVNQADPSEVPPVDSWKVQYLAANKSEPEPCDWPIVLIRSTALQRGWFRDPRLGWGDVARGGLQVHEMPGEHDAMFLEPHVEQLAAIVSRELRAAAAGAWNVSLTEG
jgi:aspartate racemase